MSQESRILRPFIAPRAFERALQSARFHMGALVCEPNSRLAMESSEEFLQAAPAISWAHTDQDLASFKSLLCQGVEDSGVDPAALGLVVVAYSRYLQLADVCFILPLNALETLERVHSFAPCRPRALQASTSGVRLFAYVAILAEQEQAPLRPWRKGHWLARVDFRIRVAESEASIFRPTPLDEARRRELGLPAHTVRYFTLNDHDPFRPYSDTEAPEFYVDEEFLMAIDRTAGSPQGKAMQADLVRDFIADLVRSCAMKPDERQNRSWDDLKDSLLGRIIRLTAGKDATPAECSQVLDLLWNDPAKLIAHAEHSLDLRRAMIKSVEVLE